MDAVKFIQQLGARPWDEHASRLLKMATGQLRIELTPTANRSSNRSLAFMMNTLCLKKLYDWDNSRIPMLSKEQSYVAWLAHCCWFSCTSSHTGRQLPVHCGPHPCVARLAPERHITTTQVSKGAVPGDAPAPILHEIRAADCRDVPEDRQV